MHDSTQDTQDHIDKVRDRVYQVTEALNVRAWNHDASKLEEPEKSGYDKLTIALKEVVYGSDEYKTALAEAKPVIDHHYAANSHHPEHWPAPTSDDIIALRECVEYCPDAPIKRWLSAYLAELESRLNGMSLLDIIEMVCDWKAASERTKQGSIAQSLAHNKQRFGISDQLASILENTVRELGW